MIKLYKPTFSSTRDDAFARFDRPGYEMDSFDLMTFWRGQRFDGSIPDGTRLLLDQGELSDFMRPACSWYIFSERAARIIERRAGDAAQFFSAPLYRSRTGERIPGYKVLNAARATPCLDLARAAFRSSQECPERIDTVHEWVFDESIIPRDLHVFRATENLAFMFFSEQLKDDLIIVEPPLKDLAFLEYGGSEVVTIYRKSERR